VASSFADKLDDFKRAAGESGCKSIPYSDLQENCVRQGGPMHDYCDGQKGLGKCLDYRRAVVATFADAQDKVRNENDTPEITELARKLRDMYEEGKRGHNLAITYKENALATCNKETL